MESDEEKWKDRVSNSKEKDAWDGRRDQEIIKVR